MKLSYDLEQSQGEKTHRTSQRAQLPIQNCHHPWFRRMEDEVIEFEVTMYDPWSYSLLRLGGSVGLVIPHQFVEGGYWT